MVAGKNNEIRDLQQLTKTMHAITKRVAGIAGCKEEARKAGKTYFVGEDKRWNAGGDFFIINYSDFSDLMNEADFLRRFSHRENCPGPKAAGKGTGSKRVHRKRHRV